MKNYHKLASQIKLDDKSIIIRKNIIKTLESGKRAHLGSALSIVEVIRVLYDDYLNVTPKNFSKLSRDRFILSKGHGCLALYSILASKKFFSKEYLLKFCHLDSILGGHPEYKRIPGIEASTGALGHGLSIGIGMAYASKIMNLKNKIVVLLGDGEINEGSIWEGAMSASKHNLSNLTVLVDYNKIQSYDFVKNVLGLEPLKNKWKSFGFQTHEINGHNTKEIKKSLFKETAKKPKLIICHTIKGKGLSFAENNPNWHHKSNVTEKDIKLMYEGLRK